MILEVIGATLDLIVGDLQVLIKYINIYYIDWFSSKVVKSGIKLKVSL